MKYAEKIVRRAVPYEAVAFDVFDTLLKRDVAKPEDLFALLGEDFAKARVRAEHQARISSQKEVTLAEIYAQPDLANYDPAQECALELAAAVPNPAVREAVRILKEQGKRVYYISDMYLPPEQIAAMLSHCGYDSFDGGFVSSSYGVQKRSGALFRRFLHETGFKAGDVLFVGDSWRADVIGAALAAIPSWHLPAEPIQADDRIEGAVKAFTQNRLPCISDYGESLGFATLGILEIAFCRWLHEKRAMRPHSRLYFLARDMFLTREIYQKLYPEEETFYLEVSRRSLCPLLLQQKNFALVAAALPRQVLTGTQIASYCSAVCPQDLAQTIYNLKETGANTGLLALLRRCQPLGDASSVQTYLRQSGLSEGDFLVDIGSGGTTQVLLEALCSLRLQGLQLSADDRLRKRFPKDRAQAFLSMDKNSAGLYWAGQPILERFLSQDVGATVGYTSEGEKVTVRHTQQTAEPKVHAIQRGVLSFAEAWMQSVLADLHIPGNIAIQPFLQLMGHPTKQQVTWLGPIQIEDGDLYRLAVPDSLPRYLLHPGDFKKDLREARWKIGFLKKLFPIPLPYNRLYLKMKSEKER